MYVCNAFRHRDRDQDLRVLWYWVLGAFAAGGEGGVVGFGSFPDGLDLRRLLGVACLMGRLGMPTSEGAGGGSL